jgi:hypothetical protein
VTDDGRLWTLAGLAAATAAGVALSGGIGGSRVRLGPLLASGPRSVPEPFLPRADVLLRRVRGATGVLVVLRAFDNLLTATTVNTWSRPTKREAFELARFLAASYGGLPITDQVGGKGRRMEEPGHPGHGLGPLRVGVWKTWERTIDERSWGALEVEIPQNAQEREWWEKMELNAKTRDGWVAIGSSVSFQSVRTLSIEGEFLAEQLVQRWSVRGKLPIVVKPSIG